MAPSSSYNLNPLPEDQEDGPIELRAGGPAAPIAKKLELLKGKLHVGTWNVRSLNGHGKLPLLAAELSRFSADIVCLTEARMPGNGELECSPDDCPATPLNSYKVYYSGHDTERHRGVAFAVRSRVAHAVESFEPVSDQLNLDPPQRRSPEAGSLPNAVPSTDPGSLPVKSDQKHYHPCEVL